MICNHCINKDNNKIIPPKYSECKQPLCVPCFNLQQFQLGLPYVCSKCEMTKLRMVSPLVCYSCAELDGLAHRTMLVVLVKVD